MSVSLEYLQRCSAETGYLGGLLLLESHEEDFTAAIQRGELRPDLLFPDNPEEAGRIAVHPTILWKIENVRNYLARRDRSGKGAGLLS